MTAYPDIDTTKYQKIPVIASFSADGDILPLYMNHKPTTEVGRNRVIPIHDGRYTFASLADQVNMNEICRKIIMGHSIANKSGTAFKTGGGSDVTNDVYTEKTLAQLLAEVNKLPVTFV